MTGRRSNPGRATRSSTPQLVNDENEASDSRSRSEGWESTTDGGASSYISPEGTPERVEDEETDNARAARSQSRSITGGEVTTAAELTEEFERSAGGECRQTPPDLEPPTTIIGAPLGRNLSIIQAADALVERWELIYDKALRDHGPGAVAGIAEQLEQAREQRVALDLVEDRETVEEPFQETHAFEAGAVAERLELLREMISLTANDDVKANIQGAIDCYEDLQLGVSRKYSLFYAGHFMEFADSWEEFTEDRPARLERYAARCGPGSLWYEPPLCGDGDDILAPSVHAMRGTASRLSGTCTHRITMSFQGLRVLPGKSLPADTQLARLEPQSATAPYSERTVGRFEPDSSKPRLAFRMILDSGASYPCLFENDFKMLGVDTKTYAATSCHRITIANGGKINSFIYELYVAVCDTMSARSLVDPSNPVWPQRRPELGGIQRVVMFDKGKDSAAQVADLYPDGSVKKLYRNWTAKAEDSCGRLSGMLPFQCCYVQSTPSLSGIWLGEDRKDVLGAQRMPGQMRFEPGTTLTFDPGHPKHTWDALRTGNEGNPVLLKMVHEVPGPDGSRIMRLQDCDGENWHGASEITIIDGTGWHDSFIVKPKSQKRKHDPDLLGLQSDSPPTKVLKTGFY